MPDRVRSIVTVACRRIARRATTSHACSTRIGRYGPASVLAAFSLTALALALPRGGARAQTELGLGDVLARYRAAIADPGAARVERSTTTGTVTGAGLAGTFRTWTDGDRERSEQTLGPRHEATIRVGDRVWFADADGDVRAFAGVLARRARTQRYIESGAFAADPSHCALIGRSVALERAAYAIAVTAPGGDTETLDLDARTWLPARVAFDDDDGRSTLEYDDWRTVAGRRYAFEVVASDGDRAYDTTQRTTSFDPVAPVDPALFEPPIARTIAMAGPETLALVVRDGLLYVPVTLAGRTYRFLLDSGSQDVVVDRGVARELGLATSGALEASGAARTGGVQVAPPSDLVVGTTGRLRDVVVTTLDLGTNRAGSRRPVRIDGVLGYPFFAQAVVRVDGAARTMTFGPPGSIAPEGERLALDTDRALPEARLGIAGTDAPFVIDTGNAAELLLYRPFVERHPGVVPYSLTVRRSFGVGGATPSYRTSLDRLDVGATSLYHAETDVMLARRGAFADRVDAGDVGLGVLRNFIVTFDEASAALYVSRGAAFDDGATRN